jgi:hypothetical protein|uniref:Uncharacterized protein n=1 Tax=Phaeodactylum tricornutum TaxID=2850 RepID=A0A8J9X222_PHATR
MKFNYYGLKADVYGILEARLGTFLSLFFLDILFLMSLSFICFRMIFVCTGIRVGLGEGAADGDVDGTFVGTEVGIAEGATAGEALGTLDDTDDVSIDRSAGKAVAVVGWTCVVGIEVGALVGAVFSLLLVVILFRMSFFFICLSRPRKARLLPLA